MPLTGDISGSLGKTSVIGVTGSLDLTYDGEGTEDGWFQMQEMASNPTTPSANKGKFFVKDNGSGTTVPYFIDAGGTVTSLLGGGGGGGSPAGSDGQIQYNNGGAFGGATGLVYDDSNGRVGIGNTSPGQVLSVQGNVSGDFITTIDNDQNTSGHVLKLLTDGNGNGSYILDMEDGDGDTVFRARADGRFGFGPDGVSSMGAGTFVVGIDNSSHTADIAISQRLQHLGDPDTYIDFPSNDNITFNAGGSEELKIASDAVLVKQFIKHDGDEDTLINFSDNKIILKAGNIAMVTAEKKGSAPHEVTINDGSNNIDFVVKGNGSNQGNPGLKFDASTNKLGINGIGTPAYELEVAGDIGLAEYIYHRGDDNTYIKFDDDIISLQAGGVTAIQLREASYDYITINSSHNDVDTIINGQNQNRILFKGIAQQGAEQVLILSGGAELSTNESSYPDMCFFVSGTIGSKNSSVKGTSLFGGDLVSSGTLWANNSLVIEDLDASEEGTITIGDPAGSVYSTLTTNQYGRLTVQTRRDDRNGEIWLDSSSDIVFDVHTGSTLELRENSTSLLKITPNSSNVDIQPQVSNKDIRLASQGGNTLLTVDSSDDAIRIDRRFGLGSDTITSSATLNANTPINVIVVTSSANVIGTLGDPAFAGQMKVILGLVSPGAAGNAQVLYTNPSGNTTTKVLSNGIGLILSSFDATGGGTYRWIPIGDVS